MNIASRILWLILIPLAAGAAIYLLHTNTPAFTFFRNYLPDGLWSFALANALILIWEGKINYGWMIVAGISCIMFEWLQYVQIVPGTADPADVCIYFLFSFFAILLNIKLKPIIRL